MVESDSGDGNILHTPSTKKQKRRKKEDTGNNSVLNYTKRRKTTMTRPGTGPLATITLTPPGPAASTSALFVHTPRWPPQVPGEGRVWLLWAGK
jgi:hypothetical protein